jgi:titin
MPLPVWLSSLRRLTAPSGPRPRRRTRSFSRLGLEALEGRWLPSTFLVLNTNDAGAGSLRQAILDANASPGSNEIDFAIGNGGAQTIRPTSPLPALTNPVVIDGTTQPGFAGSPLIDLDGANFTTPAVSTSGLVIRADNSTVKGLAITGFTTARNPDDPSDFPPPSPGLLIQGNGDVVQGNYLGIDTSGTRSVGNDFGLAIYNASNTLVGGTDPGTGNVISGNGRGVYAQGTTGGVFQGNYVGTNPTGTAAMRNFVIGLDIIGSDNLIGGTTAAARNLISGNTTTGVTINGSSNRVQGNYIGTDVTGTRALPNGTGVDSQGSGMTGGLIGGTDPGAGNLISGNEYGILLRGQGDVVQGNTIGTDVSGTQALGNTYGVYLQSASHNQIGGTASGAGNLISGNFGSGAFSGGGTGVYITSAGSRHPPPSTDNVVQGNRIGTDASGTHALRNGYGITIDDGSNNLIGGPQAGAGNLISGNWFAGVQLLELSAGNSLQGNYIGTDATGTLALRNSGEGVYIEGGSNNRIGGTAPGAGNLISGNARTGIFFQISSFGHSGGYVIQGNLIGTDVTGTQPLGNGIDGIQIGWQNSNNTVGGEEPGAGNTIAFNGRDGVFVDRGTGNAILGNAIFANGRLNIDLVNGANHNQAAPVLTSATTDGSSTTVTGTLSSTPNSTFTLEFFVSSTGGPSGSGERLLGSVQVTTDAASNASFTLTFDTAIDVGLLLSATATDSANNTSRFSAGIAVTG